MFCFVVCEYCRADIKSDYRHARNIYFAACVFVTIFCIIGGIVISVYFGSETEPACTTAWEYYLGFFWDGGYDNRADGSYVIAYFVVLLPCCVVLTASPLNILTLCNTIEESIFGKKQHDTRPEISLTLRFAITTLATIFALFIWNLDLIVTISGMGVVISCFMCVAYGESMCQQLFKRLYDAELERNNKNKDNENADTDTIKAEKEEKKGEESDDKDSVLSSDNLKMPLCFWGTHHGWIYTVYIVSTIGIVYTIVSTIVNWSKAH